MYYGLWTFLTFATPFVMVLMIIGAFTSHRQKMRRLEIERLKVQQSNLQHEVNDAVERELGDILNRIEVLEAIVTDRNYDLNEKITRLSR